VVPGLKITLQKHTHWHWRTLLIRVIRVPGEQLANANPNKVTRRTAPQPHSRTASLLVPGPASTSTSPVQKARSITHMEDHQEIVRRAAAAGLRLHAQIQTHATRGGGIGVACTHATRGGSVCTPPAHHAAAGWRRASRARLAWCGVRVRVGHTGGWVGVREDFLRCARVRAESGGDCGSKPPAVVR
jgi:hypothetical protein